MNKIELTDQELRDISHMADAAVEDAEHYMHYHGGENETDEELAELRATLDRWRALAVKFDQLYPMVGNANHLMNDREPN